jgi:hypothetical protein
MSQAGLESTTTQLDRLHALFEPPHPVAPARRRQAGAMSSHNMPAVANCKNLSSRKVASQWSKRRWLRPKPTSLLCITLALWVVAHVRTPAKCVVNHGSGSPNSHSALLLHGWTNRTGWNISSQNVISISVHHSPAQCIFQPILLLYELMSHLGMQVVLSRNARPLILTES